MRENLNISKQNILKGNLVLFECVEGYNYNALLKYQQKRESLMVAVNHMVTVSQNEAVLLIDAKKRHQLPQL